MRNLSIFLYEWRHFIRSPFKIIAILLFIIASIYGLYNGANLYEKQRTEVEKIEQKIKEERQKLITAYEEGKLIPEDRPWVDMSLPFWAVWFSWVYHFKSPSPAIVYSIGQGEQYGFYKRISFWASPYDADLAEEIANPERLQTGTLDFSFALLFLMPLVLLVLLYNIKSIETEQGFMVLIEVQSSARNSWVLSRVGFYFVLLMIVILSLILYGAILTSVFAEAHEAFGKMLLYGFLYLAFWSILYFFILQKGKSIIGNTLKMIGIYLLFAFIIPAAVHQYLSIKQPANLMTDFINVRDQQQTLYEQPDSIFLAELNDLFPKIKNSPIYKDSIKRSSAMSYSTSALVNELNKAGIQPIERESQVKNIFIKNTFWFNPVSFFQNRFNNIAQTHFEDYQSYRDEIQTLIDQQIQIMVLDMWKDKKIDKQQYLEYYRSLTKLE